MLHLTYYIYPKSTPTPISSIWRLIKKNGMFLLIISLALTSRVSGDGLYFALVAPITKDTKTSLYSITLNFHEQYVIDLDSPFLWYNCEPRHPTVSCETPECTEARRYLSPLCHSSNNTIETNGQCKCVATPVNPVTGSCAAAQMTKHNYFIYWTNGRNPAFTINFGNVDVSCAPKSLLKSLPKNVTGMASLSKSKLSLLTQFTLPFLEIPKKFAICFPSTDEADGVLFFGDGPYYMLPPTNFDASTLLSYTPLLDHPTSPEYYIGLNAILINGEAIRVPAIEFEMDPLGHGGVKLSTVVPYTTLRRDIYKPFLKQFEKAIKHIPRANKLVEPFDLCVDTSALGFTRVGLPVPNIDLALANGTNWTIFGSNSMKMIGDDVACLAFVDGGKNADQAVVIGSFQMENNFLQFDLVESKLGFSSSLLFSRTTCGNFNFTIEV